MQIGARSLVVGAVVAIAISATGCEEWGVERCLPTTVKIDELGSSSVTVSLRSGDAPLRKRTVQVEARAHDRVLAAVVVEIDRRGRGVAEFLEVDLAAADTVVVTHDGDDVYCGSEATANP